jgi:hypothetical protein
MASGAGKTAERGILTHPNGAGSSVMQEAVVNQWWLAYSRL